jgi:hypothetical protein
LTIGGTRLEEAEDLLEAGNTEKAVQALIELQEELPDIWIDRAADRVLT